jgi:hypothetical protein
MMTSSKVRSHRLTGGSAQQAALNERSRILVMLRYRAGSLSAEANKLHEEHAYDFEWRKRMEASTVREVIRWIEAM